MNEVPAGSSADRRLHTQWKARAKELEAEVARLREDRDEAREARDYHYARIESLETALRPFAESWRDWWPKRVTDWDEDVKAWPTVNFTFGDIRRANLALVPAKEVNE